MFTCFFIDQKKALTLLAKNITFAVAASQHVLKAFTIMLDHRKFYKGATDALKGQACTN